MNKDKKRTELQLHFYRNSVHVLLLLISVYSAFIGKTHIITVDIAKGIRCALFLYLILGICQIPEFIMLYKETKGGN